MKIIAIGDIHASRKWEQIVTNNSFDHVVFIGDYFDTFEDIPGSLQIANFLDICRFKELNPNKVTLLIGNHDYHYMKGVTDRYSGYQRFANIDIQIALEYALDQSLLQVCKTIDNYIFSHAGFTSTWSTDNFTKDVFTSCEAFEKWVNKAFVIHPEQFKFSGWNGYGDDITQGPLWVRPMSLQLDSISIDNSVQVVGHTQQKNGLLISTPFIFIDCLHTTGEFLVIEDGIPRAEKI